MNKKNEVTKVEDHMVIPDFMRGYTSHGTENLDSGDYEIPRIKLIQALSPEKELFEGVHEGHFWHSIAQKSLGNKLEIVPVYIDKRAILWNPQESGGGILARSDDLVNWSPIQGNVRVKINKGTKEVTWSWEKDVKASRLLEWGSYDPDDSRSPPAATLMHNIIVLLPEYPELGPSVITTKSASLVASKAFFSKLKMLRTPIYGAKFIMGVKSDKRPKGSFKNYTFTGNGYVTSKEDFEIYADFYQKFKNEGVKIAEENDNTDSSVIEDEVPF